MKCYYHPGHEAAGICANCGKAICEACSVEVSGRRMCRNCLSSGVSGPLQSQPVAPGKSTNALAVASLVLGIIGLCGGLLFSIPAWAIGTMALKQIGADPHQEGAQLANAGRLLGLGVTVVYGACIACYIGFGLLSAIGSSFGN